MNGADSNTSGANEAKLRLKAAGEFDKIPAWLKEELERRGFVKFEVNVESNVIISPAEPADKTKVWFKSDLNNVPQGFPWVWNAETGAWEQITPDQTAYVPTKKRFGAVFSPAGSSTPAPPNFESLGTIEFFVTLTPTLFIGGAWQSPPGVFPDKFGYFVGNKTENSFSVSFFGIPAGGLSWEWKVEEKRDE